MQEPTVSNDCKTWAFIWGVMWTFGGMGCSCDFYGLQEDSDVSAGLKGLSKGVLEAPLPHDFCGNSTNLGQSHGRSFIRIKPSCLSCQWHWCRQCNLGNTSIAVERDTKTSWAKPCALSGIATQAHKG
eukprot:6489735-Amphidinium_carterae.5